MFTPRHVYALFTNRSDAVDAYNELQAQGCPGEHCSVLLHQGQLTEGDLGPVESAAHEGAWKGAAIAGATGAILTGLVAASGGLLEVGVLTDLAVGGGTMAIDGAIRGGIAGSDDAERHVGGRSLEAAAAAAAPPPLSPTEQADLLAALDDEYKASATYAQVIADFGDVRPFSKIVVAERRHADAVARLLRRYGVPVPSNTWPGRVPRYGSLREACEAAVAAEVELGAMYERLLAGTTRPDIRSVYRNLQEASQQRHLPAFRRCVEREAERAGRGPPHGARHRRGPG